MVKFNTILNSVVFIWLAIAIPSVPADSASYIGIGMNAGLQRDAGNLKSYSGLEYDPQYNFILGLNLVFDLGPVFIKTGADTTFKIGGGKIITPTPSVAALEKVNIQYTSFPCYAGISAPVRDRGTLFIGTGGAYTIGRGSISAAGDNVTVEGNIFAYGIITGIQLYFNDVMRFYMDLEYLSGRSSPVADVTGSGWKDFPVDYSGFRLHAGILYYVL